MESARLEMPTFQTFGLMHTLSMKMQMHTIPVSNCNN